jgi:hypothetical protein
MAVERMRFRCLAIVLVLSATFASDLWGQSQESPKPAPEVKTQPSESAVKAEPKPESHPEISLPPPTAVPEVSSANSGGKCEAHCPDAEREGTEFWPPVHNYRLKVSDTLLVAFTALLFLATLALWWSTRRLVQGAEKTAERQLRAYVFVHPVGVDFLYDDENCRVTITYAFKNFGQTPAYQLQQWAELRNFMVPTTDEIKTPEPIEPLTAMNLGPGAEVEGTVWAITDIGTLNELGSSLRKAHVTGIVKYIDAFGYARQTKFCFFVANLGEILAKHTGTGGVHADGTKFWFSKHHNGAT